MCRCPWPCPPMDEGRECPLCLHSSLPVLPATTYMIIFTLRDMFLIHNANDTGITGALRYIFWDLIVYIIQSKKFLYPNILCFVLFCEKSMLNFCVAGTVPHGWAFVIANPSSLARCLFQWCRPSLNDNLPCTMHTLKALQETNSKWQIKFLFVSVKKMVCDKNKWMNTNMNKNEWKKLNWDRII